MKRLVFFMPLLILIGCGETPSQPELNLEPEMFVGQPGTTAEWYFSATLQEGGTSLTGQWTWTQGFSFPRSPCKYQVFATDMAGTFTVGSDTYDIGGTAGIGVWEIKGLECDPAEPPYLEMNSWSAPSNPIMRVLNADISDDDVLAIPPVPQLGSTFTFTDANGKTWIADLTYLGTTPEPSEEEITKDDCKGGGWSDLGFRNQGQCIRFVNTGKDSR